MVYEHGLQGRALNSSRLSGLYRLGVAERIDTLQERGFLSGATASALRAGRCVLRADAADRMVENALGVFGLPFAVAPNFKVNGRECLVPLAIEEPSVVAALSGAALLARDSGGFSATAGESLLTGQIHLTHLRDIDAALATLRGLETDLLNEANAIHPRLIARGGGARRIELRRLKLPDGSDSICVHVLVDTANAMGANLVNTICETLAPRIAGITRGRIALCILSNLADRSLVTARVTLSTDRLAGHDRPGHDRPGDGVRDAIVLANDIAIADPYRAATHNKGIMNGIDALAIATGNDWRAIEAGVHAFAASSGIYRSLTDWSVGSNGELIGEITLPLKVGIVGGTLALNTGARLGIALTGVSSAPDLAQLMAAVGLAQNFAALRALVTDGIQLGHMRLHARSVAAAAQGSPGHGGGELLKNRDTKASVSSAAGKVILLGEHAAVYGSHVLALPLDAAVTAHVEQRPGPLAVSIPDWGILQVLDDANPQGIAAAADLILRDLKIDPRDFAIHVQTQLPRGMGLGSSAAIAVAIIRSLAAGKNIAIDNERVNALAYECEKIAHGTPSGVDNTIATYACPMLYKKHGVPAFESLLLGSPPPLVIAFGANPGSTLQQVALVRERREQLPAAYDALFAQIDNLARVGATALVNGDYQQLGALMNTCHGLLNAIQVSTPELEQMVCIARDCGAAGAKLTGAGGGGAIVALCPGTLEAVRSGLEAAGFTTLVP